MARTLKKSCGKKKKSECKRANASCVYTKKNGSGYCKYKNKSKKSKKSKKTKKTKKRVVKRKRSKNIRAKPLVYTNELLDLNKNEYIKDYNDYSEEMPEKKGLIIEFDNSKSEANNLVLNFDKDEPQKNIDLFINRDKPFEINDIEDLDVSSDDIDMQPQSNISNQYEIGEELIDNKNRTNPFIMGNVGELDTTRSY